MGFNLTTRCVIFADVYLRLVGFFVRCEERVPNLEARSRVDGVVLDRSKETRRVDRVVLATLPLVEDGFAGLLASAALRSAELAVSDVVIFRNVVSGSLVVSGEDGSISV